MGKILQKLQVLSLVFLITFTSLNIPAKVYAEDENTIEPENGEIYFEDDVASNFGNTFTFDLSPNEDGFLETENNVEFIVETQNNYEENPISEIAFVDNDEYFIAKVNQFLENTPEELPIKEIPFSFEFLLNSEVGQDVKDLITNDTFNMTLNFYNPYQNLENEEFNLEEKELFFEAFNNRFSNSKLFGIDDSGNLHVIDFNLDSENLTIDFSTDFLGSFMFVNFDKHRERQDFSNATVDEDVIELKDVEIFEEDEIVLADLVSIPELLVEPDESEELLFETANEEGSSAAMPQDVEPSIFPITKDGISVEKATIRWLSRSTGSSEPAKFDDLVLVPPTNTIPNQQWQLDFALSGKGFIEPGDLEITVPAFIWKDRDGNQPGRLTLAIPEEPDYDSFGLTWRRVDDTYVITNYKRISAGNKYMIQGTYRMTYPDPNSDKPFTTTPATAMVDIDTVDENAEYKGISDWLYADIYILTPQNQEELEARTNLIRATVDTKVVVTKAEKTIIDKDRDVYIDRIPTGIDSILPENPEDYYYVKWYIGGSPTGNQPYTMTFTDTLTDEYNGIMLGFTSGNNKVVGERTGSVDIYNGTSTSTKSTYVWSAYPKSSFPTADTSYTVTNSLTVDVVGEDDKIPSSKSATASAVIKTPPPPNPPITYYVDKVWEYNDDKYSTDLETIKERRPDSITVRISGCNFSDTLSDENEWHTEYTNPEGWTESCKDASESGHTRSSSTSSPRVYRPDGSSYYTQTYWEWYQRNKVYNPTTRTWTFYNAYREGTRTSGSSAFSSSYNKKATNHTNNLVRATTDKDLTQLRNNQESSEITYNVSRSIYILPYTAKKNSDYNNLDNLHQNTVRFEMVDHTEYLENKKLTEDEYYFTFASLTNPTVMEYRGSSLGYGSSNKVPAEMWGKVDGEWVKFAEIDASGNIETFNFATKSGDKIFFQRNNVVQTKLVAKTTADYISASYNVGLKIKPSDQISAMLENSFSYSDYIMMTSRNDATYTVYDDVTNSSLNSVSATATTYLHGRNYALAVDLDKETKYFKNDKKNRQLWFKNTITLHRTSTISDVAEFNYASSENLLADSKSGVFYDLLPAGMRVDESSVLSVSGINIKTVNITENYKNSGRQLLIIEADILASSPTTHSNSNRPNTYPDGVGWAPVAITFNMTYSYDEAKNRGLTGLRNHAAYVADEDYFGDVKYWSGEKDIPNGNNHTETLNEVRSDVRELMTDLSSSDSPNTIYAGSDARMTEVDFSALTSVIKQVSITGSDNWLFGHDNEVNVSEGGKYSYRITLTSGTDTTTKDIIILDTLETYTPIKVTNSGDSDIEVGKIISLREFEETNEIIEIQGGNLVQGEPVSSWKGYFRDIDISEITSLGIDAKVYYSTEPDISITNYNPDGDYDVVYDILENSGDWKLTPPQDLSTVTAIAIDCRKDTSGNDFKLKEKESLIAYVHMKAPTYEQQPDAFGEDYKDFLQNAHSFNNVFMDVTQEDEFGLTTHSYDHFDFTQVGIYGVDVNVKKVWDDQNNNDHIRPQELEVELIADGVQTGKKAVLTSDGKWEAVFEHVQEFNDNDEKIVYTISEGVENYTSSFKQEKVGNLITITATNKHELFKTNYPFFKVWESQEPSGWESNIPPYITVRLYADGVFSGKTQTVRPNAEGEWAGIFTNLQKFKNGREIVYSVEELPINSDWKTTYEGNEIKNTYYPYGDLIVKKSVINSTPESKDNLFNFTITLKDKTGEDLLGDFNYVILDENNKQISSGEIKNGDEFQLKENWRIEIKDIPSNSTYEISEDNKAGYVISSKVNFSNRINADKAELCIFTNTYNTTGNITLSGNKTLSGRNISRNQFRFELYENETLIRTSGNSSDGDINFGTFTYNIKDNGKEFIYTIKEIARERPGYTYDDKVYTVKVYPIDNGDGTMTVTKKIFLNEEEVSSVDFANEYHAEGEIILRAWKDLKGRKLLEDEFEFELIDEENNVIDTKTNKSDGSIVFDALHFDETDIGKTYFYAIREKIGSDPTVNYDDSVFGYALTILDNGNGTLSVSQGTATPILGETIDEQHPPIIGWNAEDAELPIFKNTLKDGSLTISKLVENEENANPDQEFKFKIKLIGPDIENKQFEWEKEKLPYNAYLIYDANGGEFSDGESEVVLNYLVKKGNSSLINGEYEEPTRDGCVFDGWYEDEEFNVEFIGDPEELSLLEDKRVYARWETPETYAVYDSSSETVTFFRDVPAKYTDNQIEGTKTYYTGIETTNYTNKPPWYSSSYKTFILEDVISPISTSWWFAYSADIIGIDKLDTSNVTDMKDMFYRSQVTSLDISSFDTSKVTNMSSMFNGSQATSLDFSNFNTSNVTNMDCMFCGCNATSLDLSSFDTSSVTDMGQMFQNATATSLDLSSFDTSKVTKMDYMFYKHQAPTLDLSSFNTSNVTDMEGMFMSSLNLNLIYVSELWNTAKVSYSDSMNMFKNCTNLPNFNSSYVYKTFAHYNTGGYLTYKPAPTLSLNHSNNLLSTDNKYYKTYSDKILRLFDNFNLFTIVYAEDDEIVFENGEAEVTLKKNEKITFNNIPAGTAYQVWEETPDGWVLIEQRNTSGEIMPLETSEAEFKNRYQPGTTSVQFNGTKLLDNITAEEGSFSFELYEGEELLETVSVLDGGFIQFTVLSYTEAGTHNYTIKEVNPNSDTIDFDTHVENISVVVRDNGDGTLSSEVIYDEDGIVFRNSTRPGTLEIKKNVDISTNANKDDVFTFEIEFTNENGVPLSSDENIYWYRKDANGNFIQSRNLLNRGLALITGNEEYGLEKSQSKIGDAIDEVTPSESVVPQASNELLSSIQDNIDENTTNKQNYTNLKNSTKVDEVDMDDTTGWISPWQHYGDGTSTIEWGIDYNGTLWLRPENGQEEGLFPYRKKYENSPYSVNPWYALREEIIRFKAYGKIKFPYVSSTQYIDFSSFFEDCINIIDIDFSGFSNCGPSTNSLHMFKNLGYIEYIDLTPLNFKMSTIVSAFDDFTSFDESAVGYHFEGGREVYHNLKTIVGVPAEGRPNTNFQTLLYNIRYTNNSQSENAYLTNNVWIHSNTAVASGETIVHTSHIPTYSSRPLTLYRTTHKIAFDANGGMLINDELSLPDVLGTSKSKISLNLPQPYKSNHKFLGWTKVLNGKYGYLPGTQDYNITENLIYKKSDYIKIYDFDTKTYKYYEPYDTQMKQSILQPYEIIASDTVLYAKWEYDGKNQINVNHYQETVNGEDYNLVNTEIIRDIPGTEFSPNLKPYSGFHAISSIETVVIDDEDLITVNYYYDRDRYTVNFDGNGSTSGQMIEVVNSVGGISSTLPKNTFNKKGAIFNGWNTQPDGSGTTYLDQAKVLNIGNHNETVTLYAQWTTNDTNAIPSKGKILVQCKAGETVVIPDLPYRTKYTIKEVNLPEGWSFDSSIGEIGSIGANTVFSSQFNNKYSAEGLAFITAHKTIIGDTPQEGQFTFELYQGNTLLQSKTNGIVDTNKEIPGNNDENIPNPWVNTAPIEFDALQFTQEDIGKTFTYTIKEVNSGDNRINYDTHTETVTITINDAGNGILDCNVVYDSNGALFTNSLKSGSLQLKKNIENPTQASEETEFNFTINLKDSAGNPITGDYPAKIKHKNYSLIIREENVNPEYSHTSNIDDTGKQTGNYSNYLDTNKVISISGATSLIVEMYYNGESVSYDWLSVWKGNYPSYKASSNATSTGYVRTSDGAPNNTNKFGGSQSGSYTVNGNNLTNVGYTRLTIPGDSVTFGFKSDSGGAGKGYGYYAIITPLDDGGNPLTRIIKEEQGYTETTISNGGILTLKGGEELELTSLPDGATYEIIELDSPGWENTFKAGDTGQIIAGETQFSEFTNIYTSSGHVTIEGDKTLYGGDIKEEPYEFNLLNENGDVLQTVSTSGDGKFTFNIDYLQEDDGQTFHYYISEKIDEEIKNIEWDKHIAEVSVKVEDDGEGELIPTVTFEEGALSFTNVKYNSLEISKEVTGNFGNKSKDFRFKLILSGDYDKHDITWKKGEETGEVSSNEFEFTLSHGDTMTFEGITTLVKYDVVELDSNKQGYFTKASGSDKTSIDPLDLEVHATGTLKEDTSITFTNDSSGAVPTEIRLRFGILSVLSIVILAAIFILNRKRKLQKEV